MNLTFNDWMPMDTAPKGHITESVGCRGASNWFQAKCSEKYKAANPGTFIIRRRAWPQEDSWQDRNGTIFSPDFFDAWRDPYASERARHKRLEDHDVLVARGEAEPL